MIEFINVDKEYENGFKALKNVNLTIEDGEFVAIIGGSGAGKSTLIRTINKMHDITSGKLTVNGKDVSSLKGQELRDFRRDIGMVFQGFNLVERTTVQKNVLSAFIPELSGFKKVFGLYSDDMKKKALEALDSVDILDKAYQRTDALSGGQKQRVALARTIVQKPTIILADEPIASLDPVTSRQVMNYFTNLNQKYNITILINIHDVDMALKYATRVLGVRKGEIVFSGHPSEVNDEVITNIYGQDPKSIVVE
ncbi:phosphonate ABC transporter ATP-binding protein [Peptoniphilus sp. MSJ-1]|uniref:Phosphonate ABC transporter ATP-binding protein n=1 Tax=Peptoniphilus ovalis TaxID=2841503 RepID=A0ABS6FF48_9FIRM|nr:phosphonate ABC transporter ATP-binding protein [Peptoniphilus ovalis]MBU5668795.1 phosphonate ABC transporter ATP-binding protein [Peptoniphilus ovalis]